MTVLVVHRFFYHAPLGAVCDACRERAPVAAITLNGDSLGDVCEPCAQEAATEGGVEVTEDVTIPHGRETRIVAQPFKAEAVVDGEKGIKRQRKDKRIKRYLPAKRPKPETGPGSRVINYRTEACLAVGAAKGDLAGDDIIAFLIREYEWAVFTLEETHPHIDWRNDLKKRPEPDPEIPPHIRLDAALSFLNAKTTKALAVEAGLSEKETLRLLNKMKSADNITKEGRRWRL